MSAAILNTSDESGAVSSSEIRKIGYLRKLKTMKKKFFVLRAESGSQPARLEYYENEKKWKTGAQPKRSIALKTCFNINRKLDIKQKHAIALYTKDDCFTLIMDNEEELEGWLNVLLALQHGDDSLANDQPPKPTFEHVWQVNVRNRGLANSKNIIGPYHLCLTSQTLSLVKLNAESPQVIEFPLMSIRRCGHSYCFFFMELGRSAVTGSGELWMQTEDIIIAQNMHETILNAMRSSTKDDVTPRQRTRSSSTNEASKPISVHMRRQATVIPPGPITITNTPTRRERSDSVPSRPRTISEGPRDGCSRKSQMLSLEIQRPHSMYSHVTSYSPPSSGSRVASPGSAPYATDSAGSSISIEDHDSYQFDSASHQVQMSTSDPYQRQISITEEPRYEDYLPMTPPDGGGTFDGNVGHTSPARLFRVASGGRPRTPSTPPTMVVSADKPMSPQLSGYMQMTSLTNSPSDSEGYMAMSPVGSIQTGTPSKSLTPSKFYLPMSPTGSTGGGSRKTSLDENTTGYVSMAPQGGGKKSIPSDVEGYMDMKPSTPGSVKEFTSSDVEPSVTSGTPSTDIRFSEFQLEKVRTFFTATENAEDDEKLVRAYSVGSKSRTSTVDSDQPNSPSRVRAFSVGSRVGVQFGKKKEVESNSKSSGDADVNCGKKSLSAPLLSSSISGLLGKVNANHNEDLMELDFAKSGIRNTNTESSSHSNFSLRPRTNSRSSGSRLNKPEWLQVIGETSYPALEQQTTKRQNNYNDIQSNNNNNSVEGSVDPQQTGGEYVNIDLGRRNETRNKMKTNDQHEYVNLQVGSLTMSNEGHIKNSCPSKSPNPSPSTGDFSNRQFLFTNVGSEESRPEFCSSRNSREEDDTLYENVSFDRENSNLSDKELNYASLDLAPTTAVMAEEEKSPGIPHTPTPGKNLSTFDEEKEKLLYARIDFTKSEGLRTTLRDIRQ